MVMLVLVDLEICDAVDSFKGFRIHHKDYRKSPESTRKNREKLSRLPINYICIYVGNVML